MNINSIFNLIYIEYFIVMIFSLSKSNGKWQLIKYIGKLEQKNHDNNKNKGGKSRLIISLIFLLKNIRYFRGDIVDGKIIIRTFLFLIKNATPEYEKLHANTGIEKEDTIYLAINKLSAFISSDIRNNKRAKEIFVNAGCESLFGLDSNIMYSVDGLGKKTNAELILNYLKLL